VVGKGNRLLGLVSRSDALRWQVERSQPDMPLAEILSDASQPMAYRHSPIGEVADLMVETGIGRVPIVDPDSGAVVGILSRHDLLKARGERRRAEFDRERGGAPA
jgi:CBS domain-containing protein